MIRNIFIVIIFTLSSNIWAFPTTTAFNEDEFSFTYTLTASNGVTGNDETESFDKLGFNWTIELDIYEDDTFDDELTVSGSVLHNLMFEPEGPAFLFNFVLDDNQDYDDGEGVLQDTTTSLHPVDDFPLSKDAFEASLTYVVGGSCCDDFTSYVVSISGTHVNMPEPPLLTLLLAGLVVVGLIQIYQARGRAG